MKYTQTGVQDTFKSLVFFPNGMGPTPMFCMKQWQPVVLC